MRPNLIKAVTWPRTAHQQERHRRSNTKPRRRAQAISLDHQRSGSASLDPKDASAASPDPCERSPTSPDPEGDLRFTRPRGNGFGRTHCRDVGPPGSHRMTSRAGGRTSGAGPGKYVPRHDLWKGQTIIASSGCPPHRRSSRKTHRGLTPSVLSGRTL
jgi:hypothetical protein